MNKLDFKAWHTTDKKWITEDVVLTSDVVYASCWDYRDTCESYNIEFVLSTGVLDKNQNKIYGRDILKADTGEIGRVYYSQASWFINWVNTAPSYTSFLSNNIGEDCEIIGNEFEHPHLLKEE